MQQRAAAEAKAGFTSRPYLSWRSRAGPQCACLWSWLRSAQAAARSWLLEPWEWQEGGQAACRLWWVLVSITTGI